jgi:cytochrome c-type biogenesis protein CcmF
VSVSAWQVEHAATLRPGERFSIAGYDVHFREITAGKGPNYQEQTGKFAVSRGGVAMAEVAPSRRLYDAPRQATTEAGIWPTLTGDLYVVLGEDASNGAFAIRAYFNPMVRCIWLGAVLMFIGGMLSLSDRRLRVGAPRRSRAAKALSPLPAE